jgi:hypothetical protein
LVFFSEYFGFSGLFWFVSKQFDPVVSLLYQNREFQWSIERKQTEDQLKQFDREHILIFFRTCRVVLLCFDLFQNSSVCFSCFDIGSKQQTETNWNFCF